MLASHSLPAEDLYFLDQIKETCDLWNSNATTWKENQKCPDHETLPKEKVSIWAKVLICPVYTKCNDGKSHVGRVTYPCAVSTSIVILY
jgi:hypothetical protein